MGTESSETGRKHDARKFIILFVLYGLCSLIYYFGELVDLVGWEALRLDFFYGVHDIQRLLFLAPILYAAYTFGVKATIILTLLTTGTFMPRALFISPFPTPLLRSLLFILIAGTLGYFTARMRKGKNNTSRPAQLS